MREPVSNPIPEIRLNRNRWNGHPWIFAKDLQEVPKLPPGSIVNLATAMGEWFGRGYYNGHARIRARVLTTNAAEAIDEAFFSWRLNAASELRQSQLKLDATTQVYRLVNSEGDGLSGLVIDRYADLFVIQYFSAGMFRNRETIRQTLQKRFGRIQIYSFSEKHVQKQESFDHWEEPVPAPRIIEENGVRFWVNPGSRHKTGFFADQRDNRLTLATHCAQRSVLDLCAHSGGFGLYALLKGKAAQVTAVDSDPDAVNLIVKNADLNQVKLQAIGANIFEWLKPETGESARYGVVVLDPPKQTRSVENKQSALGAYFIMNKLALAKVEKGGLFLTCSCSGLVNESEFRRAVSEAAVAARRQIEIFASTGAGADHPVLPEFPEGRYLKALWCRVIE